MNVLIIFIKNPEMGKVKTRLAASIGDDAAMQVYQELSRVTREAVANATGVDQRWLFYSQFIDQDDAWSGEIFHKYLQQGESLGDKMENAFQQAFEAGATRVTIVGSDCAEINPAHINAAFGHLEQHDFVLGPANDGGYYLHGMRAFHPEVFHDKEWSTENVLQDALDTISELNKTAYLMEELVDVDYLEDLEKVKAHLNLEGIPL